MPKTVYGLVDADWPTIPFSIKPREAKELPENEEDAETILNSGYVSKTKPEPLPEDADEAKGNRPLSKSEERRLNASKYPEKGDTDS